VTDYPSAVSPLTRPSRKDPALCERWDIFIGGMEVGPAYTELNDPDIQLAKFTEQLKGADDEESTFRTLDEDFVESLRVGMPPAGGLGIGIDRLVMLLTDSASIRDVILFPLLKSMAAGEAPAASEAGGA
jgi:lysyl-tRNA synthetase class 2